MILRIITFSFIITGIVALVVFPPFSAASGGVEEGVGEPMVLTVEEAVRRALERNLDLRAERRNTGARESEIGIERGRFDPEFQMEVNTGRSLRPSASAVDVAILAGAVAPIETTQLTYQIGLEQTLASGMRYGLNWNLNRLGGPTTVFDPNFSSELSLELTHPLLRGFGPDSNKTEVVLARNNFSIALEDLAEKAVDLAVLVEETYWDLVLRRTRFKVEKEKHRAALELLEINRAKVREGILPPIEVLVAEAAVSDREEDVLTAEKLIRDAEDEFRFILNEETADLIKDVPVIPEDDPERDLIPADLSAALETARKNRPDLRRARLELDNRERVVRRASNSALPALDLEGRTGLAGLGETRSDDFDRLSSGDFYSWQVGLVFSVPIGNRTAKNTLERERQEARRAQLALIRLEQDMVVEIKEAVRRVQTDHRRIGITKKARVLAEKKLETEAERFRLGLTTTRQVLEFQNDLAEAKSRELQALTDYNKSKTHFARTRGTLLEDRGLSLR